MLTILVLLACGVAGATAAQSSAARVLVVYSSGRLLPTNVDFDHGLTARTDDSTRIPPRIFTEFLDSPEFGGEAHEVAAAAYFKEKYAARAPMVVVGAGKTALAFCLGYGAQMFPGAPIVYGGVDRADLNKLTVPADVIGVPADLDVRGTLELALRLQPDARRLVVVTGASGWDHERRAEIRAAIEGLHLTLPVQHLAGLRDSDVAARLATLAGDTIVLTPGYFTDGDGRAMTPRESVTMMAAASGAPIYALYLTQIGAGAVGGRVPSFREMGRQTRLIVDRVVDGVPARSIAVPSAIPTQVNVDWRQIRRWGIPEDRIPPDAVIQFREPSLWQAYRAQAIIALAVMFAQAGLIAALLVERGRRRRAVSALAESEQHIRLAAQAAQLSTFAWNLAGKAGVTGSGLRKRRHPSPQTAEHFEHVLQSVYPADRDRFGGAIREAAANSAVFEVEYRTLQPDGEVRWFAARGQPKAGDSDCVIGVSTEITARKAAELQLEANRAALTHLSRVATMGEMSASIAHQLNQPLTAILGNAETARKMLGRKDASPEELGEILDDIVDEDNRAAEIIRRLGALYKRGEISLSELDLNDLVRETFELLHAELALRQVVAVHELAVCPLPVQGSRVHLQQVLINLVLNAADAMAAVDPRRRVVVVRTSCDGTKLRLCVLDRGTGIPPDDLPRVFDAFWSTKANGLGIGLAICKAIIDAHRGTLTAENSPEGGATFCFALPLTASG